MKKRKFLGVLDIKIQEKYFCLETSISVSIDATD